MEIKTRPITKAERLLATEFQSFLTLIYTYNADQHKTGKTVHDLYDDLKAYGQKFARSVKTKLEEFFEIEEHNQSKLEVSLKFNDSNKKKLDAAIQAFSEGDLNFDLNFKSAEYKALNVPSNFLERSASASFFSGGKSKGLLDSFTKSEMKDVIDTKLDQLTYLSLTSNESDWQKYVYFIQSLTDKDVMTLTDSEKITWLKYTSNPEREHLFKLIDDYQYSNDKRYIEQIVALIEKDADIKALNDVYRSTKVVYRGIASDNILDAAEIVKLDREAKYVSTTPDKRTALQFSERRGHLEKEARSKYSYLITYNCKPKAVLFATDIFGRVFGEVDYVLDVTKATAKVLKVR